MPPPMQNQSSRAALVTWTVVATILFVVATVLAIFSGVAANKSQQELQTLTAKYNGVLADTDLTGDTVTTLTAVKTANPAAYPSGMTLLNVALAQRDGLARTLAGVNGADAAAAQAATMLKNVKATKGVKAGGDNLVAVTGALLNQVTSQLKQLDQMTMAQKALAAKLAAVKAATDAQLAAKDADVGKATAASAAAQTELETYRTAKNGDIETLTKSASDQNQLAQDTVNTLTAQQQEAAGKAKKLDDQIKALQNKLRDIRLPVDQILRQADAHVMRLAGDGILYIDLGTGDQVTNGMTFEIYDHIQGIPKPGEAGNDEGLPKGKASIEIIKVSPGSSECRIVRQTPGETVVEGDNVINIVYDKNVKYNVMVYGNFDLDRNGQASPQDADVIKRLVTKWGGKVATKLNADTDFLVIGKVPEIPTPSPEEADRPEVQFELERKKKEVAEYDEVLSQAIQLNIPVMNQNRFLYFTGYYEQSAR